MEDTEFMAMTTKGKRYAIDITLRNAHESYEDFIKRAKADNLGTWVDKK